MAQKPIIPPRSKQAITDLIDLTDTYTHTLADVGLDALPGGVQCLADAAFDVRGAIRAAEGVAVNWEGPILHLLLGARGRAEMDTRIGEIVLHYADGKAATVPLVYGRNIADCAVQKGDPLPTDAAVAWTSDDGATRVWKSTARNPYPAIKVVSLDVRPANAPATSFLIALTFERHAPTYEAWTVAHIDDFCPIAPRPAEAGPDLVDLTDHYTSSLDDNWFNHAGHDLRDVPRGVQVMGGVPFDIRGLIQTAACKTLEITGVVFAETVRGIAVNRKGASVHFLQGCFWNTQAGNVLGEYVIHYADGETRSAPIVYTENITDWWGRPGDDPLTAGEIVWEGANPATASMDLITHLMKYRWDNPRPEVEIASIDIVSALIEASPFVIAITVRAE